MGILVCENILGEEFGDETDITFRIEENEEENEWKRITCRCRGEEKYCKIGYEENQEYGEETWIPVILKQIYAKNLIEKKLLDEFIQISKIYTSHDLMRRSYAIEYFGNTGSEYVYKYMMISREKFNDAYQDLINMEKEQEVSVYTLAAICNCQRRLNEIYTFIWDARKIAELSEHADEYLKHLREIPYHMYGAINERIKKILEIDDEFYAAYFIRAFVKMMDDEKAIESVYDLEFAVALIGQKSYASYLLYRMGKYYEDIRNIKDVENQYYELALEVNPRNYRALYKIALDSWRNDKTEEALDLFEGVVEILEYKKSLSVFQPIECAYLYKTYMHMGNIYMTLKKYEKAKEHFEKARDFGKQEAPNNEFYKWMFGEYGADFKKTAIKKLRMERCYDALSEAYAMMNDYDKALEYH